MSASEVSAGYFGPDERPLFGWLYRPAHALRTAVVIVPPFGYEAICAARSLRHFAEAAARENLIALRFDLDGTGDSAGDDLDPDRLRHWLASIDAACDLVRSRGAERIVLVGIRLGVLLAVRAAERRGDIDGLVAIATVPSGRALLREGSALQAALGLEAPPPGSELPERELVGFAISDATWAEISAIDLCKSTKAPAPNVLLIDRDDRPANDAWAAHLAALGSEVTRMRLPGYVEMTLDPHNASVPAAMIEAVSAFARTFGDEDVATEISAAPLESRTCLDIGGKPVVEEAVQPGDHVFAIAAHPPGPASRALVLLNAGAVGHVGPNRLYVALSRRLAAAGMLALRCDIGGIADSAAREGERENVVYHRHALEDVASAVQYARSAGATDVVVAGICSGGYHALRAALAGHPIDAIVVINPLTFHYVPGAPLDVAAFRIIGDAARYRRSMMQGASWRKLLRGKVKLSRIATVVLYRARSRTGSALRNALRNMRVSLQGDLGSELQRLAERCVAIDFIFADGDPGSMMLADQGGAVVTRLERTGKLATQIVDGADHTFTARWTHALLFAAIENALARR
jgi:alpha-beta hydrolase superfamily lysophospholipase